MATQPKAKPSLRGPFKRDAAKDQMVFWKYHRPDLWSTVSQQMRADVEAYEQARTAAAQEQERD